MNRGDATLLAQLLRTMEDVLNKLDEAKVKKDAALFDRAKKELISLSERIDSLK